jgi:hypothetical protein
MNQFLSSSGYATFAGLAFVVFGCESTGPDSSGIFEVRDSAGVAIVESSSPAWTADQSWRIEEQPLVEIGKIEGEEPYLFERISGAARLPDGRVVLVEEGTREIRIFDPSGQHLLTFGGAGEGPGEFRAPPDFVVTPGDTLVTFDRFAYRRSWFTMDGQIVRDEAVPRDEVPENFSGVFPFRRFLFFDGSFFVAGRFAPSNTEPFDVGGNLAYAPVPDEMAQTDVQLGIVHSDNSEAVLGRFPLHRSGYADGSTPMVATRIYDEFFPEVLYAVGHEPASIHIGMPGLREVRSFDEQGRLKRIQRLNVPLDPVTERMIGAFQREVEEAVTEEGPSVGQLMALADQIEFPDSVYPYSDLKVDSQGNLWLLRHDREAEPGNWYYWREWKSSEGAAEYDVIDPEGRWLGAVSVPRAIGVVSEIGADYILAIRMDEFDVPYVRVHRLLKEE